MERGWAYLPQYPQCGAYGDIRAIEASANRSTEFRNRLRAVARRSVRLPGLAFASIARPGLHRPARYRELAYALSCRAERHSEARRGAAARRERCGLRDGVPEPDRARLSSARPGYWKFRPVRGRALDG